jgi:hypothetical protein
MKIRDPDYWRETAVNARDEAKRAADPEERRLWLQLADACASFANEMEMRQTSNKPDSVGGH